jgi:phenylpropionate dioxygenase-like ring-hydroxylating dioxygenase large terminal subunit
VAAETAYLANTHPALRRCWHPVARSDEVGPEPVEARLLGETWLLSRSPADRTPAARRQDDDAQPAAITDHNGLVLLAPEPPATELLPVDEAHDPTFRIGWLTPTRAAVGAGLMIDNFLDMAHFPFVHAATIGTAESERVHDMTVERDHETFGMTVTAEHPFPHHEDPGVAAGLRPLLQRRRLTYIYRAPFSVGLRIEYLDAGGTNTIAFYVQPEDKDSCRIYAAVYRDDLGADDTPAAERMREAVRYEEAIVAEDLALQARYSDLRLPLDLRIEVHVQADRATVELRRILRDLVKIGETQRSLATYTPETSRW